MLKRYILAIMVGILIFGMSFLTGYYIMRDPLYTEISSIQQSSDVQPQKMSAKGISTSETELSVLPNAIIRFTAVYSTCGHAVIEEREVSEDEIGLTEADLAERYADWDIEEFTPDMVALTKRVSGYCPNHFIIKEESGRILIYKTSGELIKEADIPIQALPFSIQQQLKSGIVLDTEEEINAMLENLDS